MGAIKEVVIGSTVFRISRFDPFRQLKLLGDLQKEVLPAAGSMLTAVLGADAVAQQRDEQAMLYAFRELSAKLGGDALAGWAERLIDAELVSFELSGREPQKLTAAHRGLAFIDYAEILELLFHILEHNFAGPLARWAGRFGPARAKLASPSDDSTQALNKS
ncbi:MAG: phage tail assembly chaperone [Achromobacter pestifer]